MICPLNETGHFSMCAHNICKRTEICSAPLSIELQLLADKFEVLETGILMTNQLR